MIDEIVSKLNIKPGDLIEWVYEHDNELVVENEELWSRIEQRYVPIGSNLVHMCISVDDEMILWLNEKGLFHTRVDATSRQPWTKPHCVVVPRAKK